MIDRKKLFKTTFLLSVVVVISTYISWLVGFQGFLLIGEVTMPNWLNSVIGAVLFYITFIIWMGVALNEYSVKLLKLSLPYIGIYILGEYFFSGGMIASAVLPLTYILILGALRHDFKNTLKRSIQFIIIVSIYQILTSMIKVGFLSFNQMDASIYQALAMSVDNIIFQGILFLYGGEILHYERNLEHAYFPRIQDSLRTLFESNELRQEFDSLKTWQLNLTLAFYLGIQIAQCIFVLVVCKIVGNVFLEGLIILSSFVFHGLIIRDRWHTKSIVACTMVASILFLVCAKLTPSFYLFQLFPIIIGLLLTYSMYKIKQMQNKKTYEKWADTIINLTKGKYAKVGNHKEVALAKGLTESDLQLVGYQYHESDRFSQLIGKLSPWSNGDYVRETSEDDSI